MTMYVIFLRDTPSSRYFVAGREYLFIVSNLSDTRFFISESVGMRVMYPLSRVVSVVGVVFCVVCVVDDAVVHFVVAAVCVESVVFAVVCVSDETDVDVVITDEVSALSAGSSPLSRKSTMAVITTITRQRSFANWEKKPPLFGLLIFAS